MKKQHFRLFYVDGFAGSGASTSKAQIERADGLSLFPVSDVIEGSPVRALGIEPPFDHYVFVDNNTENVRSLTCLKEQFPLRASQIEPVPGDANDALAAVCQRLNADRLNRAVVFLDPFGLSVRWSTIELLAATRKVDLWYLVPVDGMSRQIKDDGSFLPGAARIDELWGSDGWRELAIRKVDPSGDLFGKVDERFQKVARAKQLSEMFRTHLAQVFLGGVAEHHPSIGQGKAT